MALFQYPKSKHKRTLAPRTYKNYRSYKRTLQVEFARVCVYCRQPDSSAPNLIFGVDHYRPKGIPRFAHLICDYNNLYYCCGSCNSRKNNYWPIDEKEGPYVVAPCEHDMAAHLRFNSQTGKVDPRSLEGEYTEELLQLNDPAIVQFRLTALRTVQMFTVDVREQELHIKEVERLLQKGEMTQAQFDVEMLNMQHELDQLRIGMQSYSGELPIAPLAKQRLGVELF